MTLLQLWAAWDPSAGEFAAGRLHLHVIAHFGSFALLALAWACGLPGVPIVAIALAVAAFGFAQEAVEVLGHAHPFEWHDALIDAAGALFGVLAARLLR